MGDLIMNLKLLLAFLYMFSITKKTMKFLQKAYSKNNRLTVTSCLSNSLKK